MDTQRKKGVLDVCVLSVLERGPSYGYMIIGEVSQCIEISDVYKRQEIRVELKRMNGQVKSQIQLPEGIQMEE